MSGAAGPGKAAPGPAAVSSLRIPWQPLARAAAA
jgi:hypothetical protein